MKTFKVVGLITSPREKGNTALLVREALKGAAEGGAEIREIYLLDYNIHSCIGCSKCLSEGECCFRDDFDEIRDLIYKADGIIIGSPTYCGTYNAVLKNLFERLGMFEVMTSNLGGKYLAGISAAGASVSAKKAAKDIVSVAGAGIFKRSYISGILGAGFVNGIPSGEDKDNLKKARELGSRISRDIISENHYPFQKPVERIIKYFMVKPRFSKLITNGKEGYTKAVYDNLICRGLI